MDPYKLQISYIHYNGLDPHTYNYIAVIEMQSLNPLRTTTFYNLYIRGYRRYWENDDSWLTTNGCYL